MAGRRRGAARIRALRPHARIVHRRRRQQEGPGRGGRARHRVPRRNRRDERRDAGEAPARAAGAQFRRVGGLEEMQADIRVIAATNQDLAKLVADGRFREDLFYRINVIPIHLPPLRERREDIPLLAEHFLKKYNDRWRRSHRRVARGARADDAVRLARQHPRARKHHRACRRPRSDPHGPGRKPPTLRPGDTSRSIPAGQAAADVLPASGFDLEATSKRLNACRSLRRSNGPGACR